MKEPQRSQSIKFECIIFCALAKILALLTGSLLLRQPRKAKNAYIAHGAWISIHISNSCAAQTIEQQMDEVFSEQNFEENPGFALLVAKEGKTIYRKAFGYANLELDVELEPDHIFRVLKVLPA